MSHERTPGGGAPAPGRLARGATWLVLLVVAAGVACAPTRARAGGAPDASPGSASGPAVRFSFIPGSGGARTPELEVEFTDGGRTRAVRSAEFRTTNEVPTPHSPWFPTAGQGLLRLRVSLTGGPGDALGGGVVEIPLQADASYEVSVFTWRPDPKIPVPPCFGCVREARFPVRPDAGAGTAAGDSLVVRVVRVETREPSPVY